ncbi:hypothetical protein Pla52o_53590 [Novipirellula galeiformis]|uniref:Uncharacterized protein n=1 Tax=Novipirellula galeiformis TaxID=2528004 RepID=A0A5C6C1T9_9BACT|nr:hypothetical protein Pla52o_53590 [Novipirellula galeiformis]
MEIGRSTSEADAHHTVSLATESFCSRVIRCAPDQIFNANEPKGQRHANG